MLRPDNQPVGCLLAGLGAVPGVRHPPHACIPVHPLMDPLGASSGSAPAGIPDADRGLCLRALAPALPRLRMNSRAPWPLRILGRLIGLAIILTGIAAAVMAARTSTGNPRTDDAYVTANVIGIAPHVEGTLVQLNVVDNQPVEENDLLFVVDPRPYEAELQRARVNLSWLRRRSAASSRRSQPCTRKSPGCGRTPRMRAPMPTGWNRCSAAASSAPTNIKKRPPRPGRSMPRFNTLNPSWPSKSSCWRNRVTSTAGSRRPRRASGSPS